MSNDMKGFDLIEETRTFSRGPKAIKTTFRFLTEHKKGAFPYMRGTRPQKITSTML
jgi:hypothetical protein